jgi:hypothetical protein
MVAKTPRLKTAEPRDAFVRIPPDLSERDLGRFYTLSARDFEIIGRHHSGQPSALAARPKRPVSRAADESGLAVV